MDWVKMRMDSVKFSLKLSKQGLACQSGMLLINIGFLAFDAHLAWGGSLINAFGAGAFASNILWTLGLLFRYLGDMKDEKHELRYLKEMEDKKELQDQIEIYKNAAKNYKILTLSQKTDGKIFVQTYGIGGCGGVEEKKPVAEDKKPESKPATKIDNEIQPNKLKKNTRVPNCS